MKQELLLAGLCLALLAGCGGEPAASQSQGDGSASQSAQGSQEQAGTHTIVDMAGNEVTLPVEINSIVDTWSAATDALFNLGAADKLVSAHSAAVSEVSLLVDPEMAGLEDYSKATAEEMLKLNPDLVIVSNDDKFQEMQNAGLNAVNLMYNTYEKFQQSTLIMGEILGEEYMERAQAVVDYTDWVTETLSNDLKDVAEEDKPVVYYVMGSSADSLYSTCGGDSIIDEWVTMAGGKLATAQLGSGMGLKDVSAEEILATNPDVIMIDGDAAAEVRDAFYNSPEWSGISAVENEKIYCIPKGCFWWGRLCGDTPLQALWAASILYPDQVSYDIREETANYYSQFKQCDLTDEQLDSLLRVDLLP